MPRTGKFLHGTSLDFQDEIRRAEHFRLRVMQYTHLHEDWVINKAKEKANKVIVDDIVQQMKDANFSHKIWKGTFLSDKVSFDKQKEYLSSRAGKRVFARLHNKQKTQILTQYNNVKSNEEKKKLKKLKSTLHPEDSDFEEEDQYCEVCGELLNWKSACENDHEEMRKEGWL